MTFTLKNPCGHKMFWSAIVGLLSNHIKYVSNSIHTHTLKGHVFLTMELRKVHGMEPPRGLLVMFLIYWLFMFVRDTYTSV